MKRIIAFFCAMLGVASVSRGGDADTKLTVYLRLAKEERWAEALPLINEIVHSEPKIATSWFNRGVCLDGLSRHKEAAESFRKAYELKPGDYGAQFRIFRSLALAEDFESFARFFEEEGKKMPEIYDLLQEDSQFAEALATKPVKDVIAKRRKG